MSHEPFETLAPVYAVGALDGDDLRRFEAHLREGCVECDAVVRDATEALAQLAREAPATIPPAHVRDALLRQVQSSARPRPPRFRLLRWGALTAAAVLAAAAFTGGVVASRYEKRLGALAREAGRIREEARRQEVALRDELAAAQAVHALLRDPATRVITLGGLAAAPGASGRMLWNDRVGGRLYVTGLTPAPAGKTYELWAIAGAAPKPAGLFDVDAEGRAVRPVAPVDEGPVKIFAVTLEPAGGVPAPTGPMVLASAK